MGLVNSNNSNNIQEEENVVDKVKEIQEEDDNDEESNITEEEEDDDEEDEEDNIKIIKPNNSIHNKRLCGMFVWQLFGDKNVIIDEPNINNNENEEDVEPIDPILVAFEHLYELIMESSIEDIRYFIHKQEQRNEILTMIHPIYQQTLLITAASHGYVDVVNILLHYRSDVNQRVYTNDGKKYTSALRAAVSERGYIPTVDCLLEAHANAKDAWVMFSAVKSSNSAIIERLVESHASVNVTSKSGDTPLMMASDMGDVETAKTLIDLKAHLNTQKHGGYTALMLACRSGKSNIVQLLVLSGADVDIKNSVGLKALDLGELSYHESTVNTLKSSIIAKERYFVQQQKLTFLLGMLNGPKRHKNGRRYGKGSSIYQFVVGEGFHRDLLKKIFTYL